MDNYTQVQDEVRREHGIARTGASLIDSWGGLIAECAEGYAWDISEYRNELRVRDEIETLLSSERLRQHPSHEKFVEAVHALDEALLALGHSSWRFPDASTWWQGLVLAKAGRDFASYCRQVYGFQVEEV